MNKGISRFKEIPRTRTGWKTIYLGLAALLIPIFFSILMTLYRHLFDKASLNSENSGLRMGFGSSMLALILSIATIINGIKALKNGECSWIIWLSMVPAILIIAFLSVFITGEIFYAY